MAGDFSGEEGAFVYHAGVDLYEGGSGVDSAGGGFRAVYAPYSDYWQFAFRATVNVVDYFQ